MAREQEGKDVDPGMVAMASSSLNNRGRRVLPARRPGEQAKPRPDFVASQIQGVSDAWFGPLQPLGLSAPDSVKGRSFNYTTGWNTLTANQRPTVADIPTLRNLARYCDLVNLAVETRKDQMEAGHWVFRLKEDRTGMKSAKDARVKEVTEFMAMPDQRVPLNRWLRKMMDDILIADQPTIWASISKGGKPLELRLIDAGLIKPLLDANGQTPLEGAAYQQWVNGVPVGNFTHKEMIWHPRSPRTDGIFGFSAVQQVYITINTAIRRSMQILDSYTEGSIPEAIMSVPDGWQQEQIANFQIYWDEILAGNLGQQRRMRFVPYGMAKAIFTKKWDDHNEQDEWMARVIMFAFGLPATAFIKQMGRANQEGEQDYSSDTGHVPFINFIKEILDLAVMKWFGYRDIEAVYQESRNSDSLTEAQADQIRTQSGHLSIDEVREDLGREGIGQGNFVQTPSGIQLIGEAGRLEQEKKDKAAADMATQIAQGIGKKKADDAAATDAKPDEELTPAEKVARAIRQALAKAI